MTRLHLLAALGFAGALSGKAIAQTPATNASAAPLSAAQIRKLLRLLETSGSRDSVPAPRGNMLGLGTDSKGDLPCIEVSTADDRYAIARSSVDPKEFMLLADADNDSFYFFSMKADFRLVKAIFLHAADAPKPADPAAAETQTVFQKAMSAWKSELDKK
jgi:hypothetical protein